MTLFQQEPDVEINFQAFYRKLELAGRKHFYLFTFDDFTELELNSAISNFEDESKRSFDPNQDDGKVFKEINNYVVTIKKFQIRQSYTFVGDSIQGNFLAKQYAINSIHYVMFVTFDFNKKRIICGYDSCGDYSDKKSQDRELFDLMKSVMKKNIHYETFLTSAHIDKLRSLSNCLAYSISNKANVFDYAKFKKSKANFDQIQSDLSHQKYKISEIKENNPAFDLYTNILYRAGISASLDKDFDLINDEFEFYYFTDIVGKVYYFRLRIDVTESSLITFSESITWEELKDVLVKIN